MSRNAAQDPCRIINSDSEDEENDRFRITARPATANMLVRPIPLKKPDWDVVLEEENQFGSKNKSIPVIPNIESRVGSDGISSLSSSSSSITSNHRDKPPVIPSESPPASPTTTNGSILDPFTCIQDDVTNFIYRHIPKEYPGFIQCQVRRDASGVHGRFFPTFYLQAERQTDGKKQFLLAAQRTAKVNRQAEYILTTNIETLSEKSHGDGYVGRLRGNNLTGTEYTLYDDGLSPNKQSNRRRNRDSKGLRRELAAIVYNANFLGFKGPRQINVMLPELGHDIQPTTNDETMLSQWRDRRMSYFIQLRNKSPKYNETTKTYVIQFTGNRVVKPSVKNFQMILETENHQEETVMQFGRVDADTFTCDYRYPLSAIQAFAIALSSFDSRIVRE